MFNSCEFHNIFIATSLLFDFVFEGKISQVENDISDW